MFISKSPWWCGKSLRSIADTCHYTMVIVCVVAVGMLYRWPHQPLLFKKNGIFFFEKKRAFLIGETDIKLTSKFSYQIQLKFSYQYKEKYQKIKIWLEFDI
jgi:hypothetical protein